VPGQVAEEIAAQVAGDANEGKARNPAGKPPQQIVGRDEKNQKRERQPDTVRGVRTAGQRIN
jgi:hypothetical protein